MNFAEIDMNEQGLNQQDSARERVLLEFGRFAGYLVDPEFKSQVDCRATESVGHLSVAAWLIQSRLESFDGSKSLRPISSPGKLKLDESSGQWTAVDAYSAIGRVEQVVKAAVSMVGSGLDSANIEGTIKEYETQWRSELLQIFKDYLDCVEPELADSINGRLFSNYDYEAIRSKTLFGWRSKLISVCNRSRLESGLTKLSELDSSQHSGDSLADSFLLSSLKELSLLEDERSDVEEVSSAALAVRDLLYSDSLPPAEAMLAVASIFYAGDLRYAYQGICENTKSVGLPIPENWKVFYGLTADFNYISSRLDSLKPELEGYIDASLHFYGGNMEKTYRNHYTVAFMQGKELPDGWRCFPGSYDDLQQLQNMTNSNTINTDEYERIADLLCGGNMRRAFMMISALSFMQDRPRPEGLTIFSGHTRQSREIRPLLEEGQTYADFQALSGSNNLAGHRLWRQAMSLAFPGLRHKIDTTKDRESSS